MEKHISTMLIGNNVLNLEALSTLLKSEQRFHIVSQSIIGLDSIKNYHTFTPDIVIINDQAKDLDYLTLSQELLQKDDSCKIIILAQTLYQNKIISCIRMGVRSIICSNDSFSVLLLAINRLLMGKTYYCGNISQLLAQEINISKVKKQHKSITNLLTKREVEIMYLLISGRSNKEIGVLLFISSKTVSAHKSNIFKKLEINSLIELSRFEDELVPCNI